MKIAVYTCITDSYAPLVAPAVVSGECDYLCFSDGTIDDVWPWRFRPLKRFFANPIRNARLPKILSHRYLADYDYSIWLDASLQLTVDPRYVIDAMNGSDLAAFRNRRRDYLRDEFRAIRESKWASKEKLNVDLLREQESESSSLISPIHYLGCLIRRMSSGVRDFEKEWFAEYCLWQHRDSPAFHVAKNRLDVSCKTIPGDIKNNEFVKWVKN